MDQKVKPEEKNKIRRVNLFIPIETCTKRDEHVEVLDRIEAAIREVLRQEACSYPDLVGYGLQRKSTSYTERKPLW